MPLNSIEILSKTQYNNFVMVVMVYNVSQCDGLHNVSIILNCDTKCVYNASLYRPQNMCGHDMCASNINFALTKCKHGIFLLFMLSVSLI